VDRSLPEGATAKHIVITRECGKYYLTVQCEVPDVRRAPAPVGSAVGVDVGISSVVVTSDGDRSGNPRYLDGLLRELRIWARAMARREKGSHGWIEARERLKKMQARLARKRKDLAHNISRQLASHYALVAMEDSLDGLRKGRLARQVHDAQWGRIREMVQVKLEEHGGELRLVPPEGTSQICSECGCIVYKTLSVRVHHCPECEYTADRDVNAARNILARAVDASGSVNNRLAHQPGGVNVAEPGPAKAGARPRAWPQKPTAPSRSRSRRTAGVMRAGPGAVETGG